MAQPTRNRPPVVVVTGPTACGKTGLAIEIATRFGGEVINADSMQVYRYMDIGTAKPSLEERARVPHHLFDVVTPDRPYNAGSYVRDARAAAEAIAGRGRLIVLAGGTGLYIRTFLHGLVEVGGADPELRERLEAEHATAVADGDPGRLHRRLEKLDPEAAARIHPNDLVRIVRALEIAEVGRRTASEARSGHAFADEPYRALHLAFDPGVEPLIERIDRRCHEMIEAGLLREVRDLRERGYGPELKPMQAIGYRHIQPVVDGLDTLANAEEAMKRDTRRFAKRQRTWLRAVPEAVWLDPSALDPVLKRVEGFLENGAEG
ncbi:MAG: tRNA (adenosine(37)-N6)-dimethylallyltransferase MiaA [Myxococcota bacterium]